MQSLFNHGKRTFVGYYTTVISQNKQLSPRIKLYFCGQGGFDLSVLFKEQTKPNNLAVTGAKVSVSFKGHRIVA